MSKMRSENSAKASPTLPLPPPVDSGSDLGATRGPIAAGKRFERLVPPAQATLVTVGVKPESICYFYHPEAPERRIQLDADSRGIVRFYARALKGAAPTEFHLECHCAGHAELHVVSLGTEIRYTQSLSAPELTSAAVVLGDVRGPLEGDPLAPTNAELLAKGYPPRPDPQRSPTQYSRWLRNVLRSFTRIDTRRVAHPEHSRSKFLRAPEGIKVPDSERATAKRSLAQAAASQANANSPNWTGAWYQNPINQFAAIQAEWNTPLVFTLDNGPPFSALSEWVGLDNGAGDLYQAGTGSECYNLFFWEITTYYMWMESLPWSWWVVPGFPVSPGDQISVDIWVADPYGTTFYQDGDWGGLTPQDNNVWFYLTNATNGASFMGTYPTAPESGGGERSTGFTGTTAEFILERPSYNYNPAPLAFFLQPALMWNCWYADAQYGEYHMFPLGADDGSQPFDGQLSYLNMVDPNNNNTLLAFPFSMPDPNNLSDAQAIQFFWMNFQ
ncbi:G1 family glutamic endopeptidase [Paraburkholderia sp. JHI869]|uniref:G1 family glutamic endopeptidase n=1 Tax=Paraburkholderia sp. JHI869 TaxID=3112959 RepID=UPI00317A8EBD